MLLCPWTGQAWFGSQLQIVPSIENISRIDCWLQEKITLLSAHQDYKETGLSILANTLGEFGKGGINLPLNMST